MPEGSSQYTYLQSKRWRALGYNWDILSSYGQSSKLYCLTDFQVAWLLSNTEYMRWSSRWQNCPCTQADLDAMKAEMEYNLMTCFNIQPYQMQTIYNNGVNDLLNTYDSLWDGSLPSSVNPNAPDDYFDGNASPTRQDALCTALTLWSYSYAVDWLQKAGIILSLVAPLNFLVDFLVPVGGNIATRVLSDLTAPLQAQFDALQNQSALDTVICDWRENLEGLAINATNWQSALSATSYTVETPSWWIQQLFIDDTQYLDNFLSFVNSLGNGYELAQRGISICACFDCEVDETFDFTIEEFPTIWFPRASQSANMTWIMGGGWQADNPGGVQLATERYESIEEVEITYTFVGSGETPRVYQYASSTGTLGALIGSLPFVGNESITEDILVALFAPSGTWTAYLETVRVKGCRRP